MPVTKISSLGDSTLIYKKHLILNQVIFSTKLKHYGIRGVSYKWFQSFLCERLQYTLIKES